MGVARKIAVWIGTSGYVYPDWTSGFYPRRLSTGRMLAYYARHFPLVELNFTFYRVPTAAQLEQIAAKSPDGFQFIVKLHQSLTHQLELQETAAFRLALKPLIHRRQLLGLLAQFPQRFHQSQANRERLARLADCFQDVPVAIEFRHSSWREEAMLDWLREHSLAIISVDVPDVPALFPCGLVRSGPLIYVRFHSRRAASWYEGAKERYDYGYSDQELTEWIERLMAARATTDRVWLLFNNCQRGQAPINALRMMELLRERKDEFDVVPPFAGSAEGERQATLFA